MPASSIEQRAAILAAVGLVLFAGWMGRTWLTGPATLAERDVEQAEHEKDAMRKAGRLTTREPPEAELFRKWRAVGRLGEAERVKRRG